jgi:hypothetical protein
MIATITAFLGGRQIAAGDRETVTRTLTERYPTDQSEILVFEDVSGRVTDLDYRGVMKPAAPRGAGRPKLGVQARKVTLLPRHWEWLSGQPGGASAALRRLVEEARGQGRSERERRDAAYHFMQASCGDMPGYEEALRALYAGRESDFDALTSEWPADVRRYIAKLLGPEEAATCD